ncbi:MAG: aminopeptidase [Lentisphaerae bacterium]|nr:aminopeptidase [Lentisphaerota bacterium]
MTAKKSTKDDPKNRQTVTPWKVETAWEKLSAAELKQLEAYCADYIRFLSDAKTERLAHDIALAMAQKAGFVDMDELAAAGKKLKAGAKVYRSYHGKTLFLAQIGKEPLEKGLSLIGAHIDSPRLDAKPNPLYQDDCMALLDTHYYGGIKKYQWVTIPLALHGVVIRRDGTKVSLNIGEDPGDPVLTITDLLPHLGAEQGRKNLSEAFSGEALNVLVASRPVPKDDGDKDYKERTKLRVLRLLKDTYGIEEEDFASAELELVPAGPARELGLDRSMIMGYGQDDRVCAYATIRAILDAKGIPGRTRAAVICDKEEIGSYGATGMDSRFMENTVAELAALMGDSYSELTVRRALARSRMLSADVNALHDPAFPEVSSPNNMAKMGCGIVISKYTGARGKSGSSDASAEFVGEIRRIFNDAGVAWQMGELGKVDCGGGGTIALYLARYGMDVVDCGVGLLSMHAPQESASKVDIYMGYKAYKAFFEAK